MVKKVVHLSSVHPVYDTRIFHKECKTLLVAGYDVSLVIQHHNDEVFEGIKLKGLGSPQNRMARMTKTTRQIYEIAIKCDADLYHFHDPELIPVGLRLKRKGKKIIYDVHEDVPRQILTKGWVPAALRKSISWLLERIENHAARKFDYVITATPYIRDRYLKLTKRTVDINNYPMLSELHEPDASWGKKERVVCYVGGIGKARGIREMVKAIGMTDYSLLLAGKFTSSAERDLAARQNEWKKVIEMGHIDRIRVRDVLSRSMAGLVVLHPTLNYIDALPVKMFEYMSAGIPVIASRFPLWEEILKTNNCGICVDPLDAEEIANAIKWIMDNPDQAKQMGENGRKAVVQKYNWEQEGHKLIKVYRELLS